MAGPAARSSLNRRLTLDECPGRTNTVRRHFSAVLRRLEYLSQQIRTRPAHQTSYFLREFDAVVFLLRQVAGDELVDRWLGAFEIEVEGWRPGRSDHGLPSPEELAAELEQHAEGGQ